MSESAEALPSAEGLASAATYDEPEAEPPAEPQPEEPQPEEPLPHEPEPEHPGPDAPGPEEPAEPSIPESAESETPAEGDEHANGDEPAPAPVTLETVGGDDIEEARPRARHHRSYKIQEVIKRRQILLVQVTKEERGTKGAALTTYLSLAGRYCVLMPNAGRGGGVSRKITSAADRRRLKELMEELEVPDGMGVIVRTAGSERSKAEIKRDFDYLLRLWNDIRELTLKSSAPALIYEEGSLIKRAIRDLYARDIDEIMVEGEAGYRTAKEFMRMLTPSHAARVKPYRDPAIPLFHRFQIDAQIDQIHNPVVQLKSGGYIVINPTEALVSIDVNSGRATRERNIEETATKTNLEAADEIARQLRLRDLAGLVVIDFIDMEEGRNQRAVEHRLKDAMKSDRARIQLGRISPFGLLELSRQRLRSSLIEASTQTCPHCNGTGTIRSTESTTLVVLRALEEEGIRRRTAEAAVFVPTQIALYLLNQKRDALTAIEKRYGFRVTVGQDDALIPPAFRLERTRPLTPEELAQLPAPVVPAVEPEPEEAVEEEVDDRETAAGAEVSAESSEDRARRKRRRRRRRHGGGEGAAPTQAASSEARTEAEPEAEPEDDEEAAAPPSTAAAPEADGQAEHRRRRRGRRGGKRHRREGDTPVAAPVEPLDYEEGYVSPLDFARDGRNAFFDDEPEAAPAALTEPAAEAPAPEPVAAAPEAATPEPAAEEATKPKRRRAPRKAAEGATDAAAEAPAKPKRSRSRKPATEVVETVPAEPEAAESTDLSIEPPAETHAVAEVPVLDAMPEPVPAEGAEDDRPRRSGWWRRLMPNP
ncbi:MAG TPA: ribonuclease E/G [Stellaceae bacterium]|nr:ribonuclease E/G [Stellaceae bacterium]